MSLARGLGQSLRKRSPDLSSDCAQRIALTTLGAVMALLDMACSDSRRARKLVDEAVMLAQRYLAPTLDGRRRQAA